MAIIVMSCNAGRNHFTKQKYTTLKHIKPTTEKAEQADQKSADLAIETTEELNSENDYFMESEVVSVPKTDGEQPLSVEYESSNSALEGTHFQQVEAPLKIVESNKKRDDKKKDRPKWQKTRRLGWWMFGLSLFLVGAGLGLAILIWSEVVAYVLWPLAAVALILAFVFLARSVKEKHGGETKHKNLKIWSLVLFIASFGLGFLGFIFLAGIVVVDLILYSTIILAVAAFVMSILMFIWSYKGLPKEQKVDNP